MRILQVAIQAQGGGAEKVALTLHNQFIRENEAWLVYLYSELKLEISNTKYLNMTRISPLSLFIGISRLHKIGLTLKPEVTLIHCEPAMLLAALTPGLGKLFLVEHQPFNWTGLKGAVIKFAMKVLAMRGCKTIHLRKSRTSAISPLYIPNPVELSSSHINSHSHGTPFQVTWVGRLSYDKGFDRVPRVLELAKEKRIEVFGDGVLKNTVNFDNIEAYFHGFDPMVWEHLPDNSLLIVTSRWEGDGLVILEALTRRIPLLVIYFESIDELPLPRACMCADEVEMALKIHNLRSGKLMLSELVNTNAIQEISASRNPQVISGRYLKAFKEVLND